MKKSYIERLAVDWEKVAGEPVKVESIGGTIYAFGSELAMLRLFYAYRHNDIDTIAAEYSKNLETWFFRFDVKI